MNKFLLVIVELAVFKLFLSVTKSIGLKENYMNISEFTPYILDKLGFGVTIIDAETHQIIYVNSKLLNKTGYNYSKIIGKSCQIFYARQK